METSEYVNQMQNIAQANNAWSAQQAQKQMDFQKMMSDTAHQREVADLKAAGLNPVLSAGGSGAASASGAMGETDQSAAGAIGSLFQTVLSTDNARAIAEMNNSAAMLRQQQSDSAAMDRLLIQLEANGKLNGSGGSGIGGSGSGSGSTSASGYAGEGLVNWLRGLFNSLPDKGNTKILGINLNNAIWKYAWQTLGEEGFVKMVQDPNAQALLTSLFNDSQRPNAKPSPTGNIKKDLASGVLDAVTGVDVDVPDDWKGSAKSSHGEQSYGEYAKGQLQNMYNVVIKPVFDAVQKAVENSRPDSTHYYGAGSSKSKKKVTVKSFKTKA